MKGDDEITWHTEPNQIELQIFRTTWWEKRNLTLQRWVSSMARLFDTNPFKNPQWQPRPSSACAQILYAHAAAHKVRQSHSAATVALLASNPQIHPKQIKKHVSNPFESDWESILR